MTDGGSKACWFRSAACVTHTHAEIVLVPVVKKEPSN